MTIEKAQKDRQILNELDALGDAIADGTVERKFTTMRMHLNIPDVEFSGQDVRELRRELAVSQAVFARIIGTSIQTVQAWEQDRTDPPPMACRLLDLIRRRPNEFVSVVRPTSDEEVMT